MKSIPLLQLSLIAGLFGLGQTAMATVQMFDINRSRGYDQSDSSTVTLQDDEPYECNVGVEESGTSAFSSATIVTPDSSNYSLEQTDEGWWSGMETDSLDEINSAVPLGAYTLTLNKIGGGSTVINFEVTSLDFPSAPHVTNFDALQAIDATNSVTISWDSWTGGSSSDFIIVDIEDANENTVYESISVTGKTSELDGTDTSITLPAGTFVSGSTYQLSVIFCKCDSFSWSGAVSDFPNAAKCVVSQTSTNLTIQTSGFPPLSHMLSFSMYSSISDWQIDTINGRVSPLEYLLSAGAKESITVTCENTALIDKTKVLFTGPAGSGLSNTAATSSSDGSTSDNYYSVSSLTPFLPNGSYTLNYDGTEYTSDITYAPQSTDATYICPSLTIQDGKITNISCEFYDASFNEVAWENHVTWGVVIYDIAYHIFTYSSTNVSTDMDISDLNISIYDVGHIYCWGLGLKNAAGDRNSIGTWCDLSTSTSINIFDAKERYDNGWISPEDPTDVTGSFGWISDQFYPWIYSASQDILTNGSYLGDGDGWMYVYPGGTLSGGFYAYRYATGSWCWTSYYWSGWIYDYGTSSWIDITP